MDQLNSPQCQGVIVRGYVNQHDLCVGTLHAPQDRVGDHHRITRAGVDHPRHAGAVHQYLQHGALVAILGDDYDGKFGHRISGPLLVLVQHSTCQNHGLQITQVILSLLVLLFCPRRAFGRRISLCPYRAWGYWQRGRLALGEMRCAVHRTISSELVLSALLLLEKIPQNRDVAQPRDLVVQIGHRLSIRPAITKLWPSFSSNSVSLFAY